MGYGNTVLSLVYKLDNRDNGKGGKMGRPAKYVYNVGDIVDDYECIEVTKDEKGWTVYKMKCVKCGKEKIMRGSTIVKHKGTSHKSCGKGLGITYDEYFYKRWQSMRQRTSPNSVHSEQYYERGINSDAFASFIDFFNAMYPSWQEHVAKFGVHDTSLDRIDVDKSYTPENCRWVCLDEQKGNVQKSLYFTVEDLETHEIQYCKNAHKYALLNNLPPNYVGEVINKGRVYRGKRYTRITKDEYAKYHLENKTFVD